MISFSEAYNIVMNSVVTLGCEQIDINDSLGRILANDVISDLNMPPFNKSAMDGYACRREDLTSDLNVIEDIPAGFMPNKKIGPGECSKIMTGAMVPEGADCVIIVEETEEVKDDLIHYTGNLEISKNGAIQSVKWRKGNSNICHIGEDIEEGDLILQKGTVIKPKHIAVMATVGCSNPLVAKRPKIGIIATGSELVEPYENVSGPQIRNSNSYQLSAQVKTSCGIPNYYGIAVDTEEAIFNAIDKAMDENDIVLISGGVSMGDYDFVPGCLKKNGVNILFDRVAIQPGKPITFGTSERAVCFGMPGNPVSTFMQFELLVRPFIYNAMGNDFKPTVYQMPLGENINRHKAVRESVMPVELREGKVYLLEYHGSAHINAISGTDYVITIPIGVSEIKKGTVVDVRQI
ncbi:MAG TPA: gephyrin-like molybdotransferase Glp [Victivallales bacterium]|nr:gephyrin-like molybdotransferase Glp [Victivallales bacterium]